MSNDQSKPFMTIKEAADRLHVSMNTVRRYITNQELKATLVGRGWRVTEEDVQAFLDTRSNLKKDAKKEKAA